MLGAALLAPAAAQAGPAAARLSALADGLIKGYTAKGGGGATVAIFPLNGAESLQKRRVGFAMSELMSHRFVADRTFTVLERGEIGKLLNEQRLQVSGAVDSDAAVKLGKILGARLLLLGNVQKVDGRYQVNARLVDVETSAVLVSGYEELPVAAFEEDAGPYLNLVPEEQALGLYFLYNTRSNANDLPTRTLTVFNGTETIDPRSFTLRMIGAGIRYVPKEKFLADVAYMRTTEGAVAGNATWSSTGKLDVEALRAKVEYRLKRSSRLAYYAGAGAVLYTLHIDGKTMYYTPMLSLRAEYRPQSRIGLSLSANYDIASKTAKSWDIVEVARLNRFYLEPTLSVYF